MITPVRNARRTIMETISSVGSQGERLGEYIVLDAESDDGTSEIVATADVVTTHLRRLDGGIYHAMNDGIALARFDVVGIINADDVLTENALTRVCDAFSDSRVDYVYSDVLVVDESGRQVGVCRARREWLCGYISPLGRDWRFLVALPHPGLFVRRRVYDEIGCFDTTLKLAADHDFIARLIHTRRVGQYVNTPLACFRLGGASGSSLRLFAEDELIAVRYGMHPLLAAFNRTRAAVGRLQQRVFRQTRWQ